MMSNTLASEELSSLCLDDVEVVYLCGLGTDCYEDIASSWLHKDRRRHLIFLEEDRSFVVPSDYQVEVFFVDEHFDDLVTWLSWHFAFARVEVICNNQHWHECRDIILGKHAYHYVLAREYLEGSDAFYENYYRSWRYNKPNCLVEKMEFKDVPAIICGAGPSLEKQITTLRNIGDRSLIIAGGTALNVLNSFDIWPHFGVGIDPTEGEARRFVSNQAYETPIFYHPRIHWRALDNITGRKIYVNGDEEHSLSYWVERQLGFKNVHDMNTGVSVITFAIAIALALGCNPIIFVGMDLGYTDGRRYSHGLNKSIAEEDFKSPLWREDVIKKNIEGVDFVTTREFLDIANSVADLTREYPRKSFFNATGGGLPIDGVANVPLEDILVNQRQYDWHNEVHSSVEGARISIDDMKVSEALTTMYRSLCVCEELCSAMIHDKYGSRSLVYEMDLQEELAYEIILSQTDKIIGFMYRRYWCEQCQRKLSDADFVIEDCELKLSRIQSLLKVIRKHKKCYERNC